MAGAITQLIKLSGAQEVKAQLTAIGKEGEKAFGGIEKSAASASGSVSKVGQSAAAAGESFLMSGRFATIAAGGILGLGLALVRLAQSYIASANAAAKASAEQQAAAQRAGQTTKNYDEATGTLKLFGLTAAESEGIIKKFGEGAAKAFDEGRAKLAKMGITFAPTAAGAKAATEAIGNLGGASKDTNKAIGKSLEISRLAGASYNPLTRTVDVTSESFATLADEVKKIQDPAKRAETVLGAFGDEQGRRLLPILELGGEAIRKQTAEFKRLQNLPDVKRQTQEEDFRKLEEANRRLEIVLAAAQRDINAFLARVLTQITNARIEAIDAINKAKSDPNKPVMGDPTAGLFGPVKKEAQDLTLEVNPNAFQSLIDAANIAFNAILQGAQKTADAMKQILSGGGSAPLVVPSGPGEMASGGPVRGPGSGTSDSILARLSNGEYVMKAAAVKHYGLGRMAALNSLRMPRFNTGGLFDGIGRSLSSLALPRLADGGTVAAGGRPVILNINGRSFSGFTGTDSAVKQVTKAATLGQISSAGRAPSWDN